MTGSLEGEGRSPRKCWRNVIDYHSSSSSHTFCTAGSRCWSSWRISMPYSGTNRVGHRIERCILHGFLSTRRDKQRVSSNLQILWNSRINVIFAKWHSQRWMDVEEHSNDAAYNEETLLFTSVYHIFLYRIHSVLREAPWERWCADPLMLHLWSHLVT